MQWLSADLHVHSVLSPCASVEMTPRNIVRHAVAAGVDIVAITDHNAGDNVAAALRAAAGSGVTVFPGMEVQTREEVHLLTLFEKMRDFVRWCDFVKQHRSPLLNDERKFGAQFVVDESDELLRIEPAMLLASTDLSVQEVAEQAHRLGGLVIAAHVDRPAYSLISQLGFVPPDLRIDAVEFSKNAEGPSAQRRIAAIGDLPVIHSSDAHTIEDFVTGPKTMFHVESPTLAEMRQALEAGNGRRIQR